jgi:hypothetical protein
MLICVKEINNNKQFIVFLSDVLITKIGKKNRK